jgi:catechol 2,3-dioxygenase-like lactoylglutathione lyase family enzyme
MGGSPHAHAAALEEFVANFAEIEVVTLFVEDVEAARKFYVDVLGTEVIFGDEGSCVVKLSNLMINLLGIDNAPELVEPAQVGGPSAGARALYTIRVDDADAAYEELTARGAVFLNGPIDRHWGRRTAAFADPAGNVWEIAEELPGS